MDVLAASVLGVEVPDTRPVFLVVVAVHVLAGLGAVISGVLAMLAAKRPGRHPRAGRRYLWALGVMAVTAAVLAGLRWSDDVHLLVLGVLALVLAGVGYRARRRHRPGWRSSHIIGMGGSYVVLLTAFYVDNGPHLPGWDRLPPVALWLLPALIGTPVIIWAVLRHREPRHPTPAISPPRP